LALNALMYTEGSRGECYAGLVHTLREAELSPHAIGTSAVEAQRNILMFARADGSHKAPQWRREPLARLGVILGGVVLRDFLEAQQHRIEPAYFEEPPLYTDDRTAL